MTEPRSIAGVEGRAAPGPPAPADHADEIGRIEGVRPCLGCGHDLHGQPIQREPEYGLLIARCPECGRVTSLVDYPMLGVWGRRIGTALMLLGLAALIPLALLTALALFGIGMVVVEEQSRSVREVLETMLAADGLQQVTPAWWSSHGGEARTRMLRRFVEFEREDTLPLLILWPVPVVLGIIWSAILSGLRRRWMWAPALGITGLVMTFAWIGRFTEPQIGVATLWPYAATFQILMVPGMALVLCGEMVLLLIGLLSGRPILRGVARFVLPPRHRRALGFLWTIDGLDPPRGRG